MARTPVLTEQQIKFAKKKKSQNTPRSYNWGG